MEAFCAPENLASVFPRCIFTSMHLERLCSPCSQSLMLSCLGSSQPLKSGWPEAPELQGEMVLYGDFPTPWPALSRMSRLYLFFIWLQVSQANLLIMPVFSVALLSNFRGKSRAQ